MAVVPMFVRNRADYRSLIWVAIAIALVAAQYANPDLVVYLSPLSCYFAVSLGTITHNHAHRETFRSRRANRLFSQVLTFFYGYPAMMWVPTHNLNHHKFVNRPGDATATWRFTNSHNLWVALKYPFMSGYFQSGPIKRYLSMARDKKPSLYRRLRVQYALWIGIYVAMLALAVYLHSHRQSWTGAYVFVFAVALPAVMSSVVIMIFNFIQHVHTDAWSDHDHSRNFVGGWFNYLFFNNGYHTAHHNKPAMHWSELRAEHERIADSVDPKLNEPNLIWFAVRQYLLAPLFPQLGTEQIGGHPGQEPLKS